MSKVKADCERGHKPAPDRVCPHVSSPWDGRTMRDPIWGMLPFAIFSVPFIRFRGKRLEGTLRVDKGYLCGP